MASVKVGVGSTIVLSNGSEEIILTDFAFGDIAKLTIPNDLMDLTTGKDSNTVFTFKAEGTNIDLEVRILLGSQNDIQLNSIVEGMKKDFVGTNFLNASVKRLYTLEDNAKKIQEFSCQVGMLAKGAEFTENTEGNTEQGVNVYKIRFAKYQLRYL